MSEQEDKYLGISAVQKKKKVMVTFENNGPKIPENIVNKIFNKFYTTKSKKSGSWRTQESTLHLFALAGGWPGAALAQQFLRHKSSKREFRNVFWFTVIINLGALIWLYSSTGAKYLKLLF